VEVAASSSPQIMGVKQNAIDRYSKFSFALLLYSEITQSVNIMCKNISLV
jgi:uncharacterized protein YheU (UPF0270 family)